MRSLAVILLLCGGLAEGAEPAPPLQFDGDSSRRTPVFGRPTPWMLEWSTRSDNSLPKIFELRLYDAAAGEFVGTIVELRETGSGRRLFEQTGRFRIDVVAQHLSWTLLISDVESEEAARLKRRGEGRATIADRSGQYARQVREDSFESWRPVDERTLLLFAEDDSHGFRITFAEPCEGLADATALLFVTAAYSYGTALYDAIMLDDGTHCTFDRVVPTVFD